MSYHVGMWGAPPYIACDGDGCGAYWTFEGVPPAWFLGNKPPPRWSGMRNESDGKLTRVDYCPEHRGTGRTAADTKEAT